MDCSLQFFTFLPDSWDVRDAVVLKKLQEHLCQQTGALELWSPGACSPALFFFLQSYKASPRTWDHLDSCHVLNLVLGCRVKTELHSQLSHITGGGFFQEAERMMSLPQLTQIAVTFVPKDAR